MLDKGMKLITYDEALEKLLATVHPASATTVWRPDARGNLILAEDLVATEPYPRFDNSAVDGYALAAGDGVKGNELRVEGFVAAGPSESRLATAGTAIRIFTGAPIPSGTNCVVMQEDVTRAGDTISVNESLKTGEHIRRAGSEYVAGDVVANCGQPVNAGVSALLAEQNRQEIQCFDRPALAVITTGDELVAVGGELRRGQIRDSVGPMLARLAENHATVSRVLVGDDPEAIGEAIITAIGSHDAIVISGGASVGDRDFIERVIAKLGQVVFHGVRMRPGKPVLFGLVNGKPVLGLPGNPASAFVCFNLFGVPMLSRMAGLAEPRLAWHRVPFDARHESYGRDVFVRIAFEGGAARPIGEQSSFGLRSLALGQGLARLVAEREVKRGDLVPVVVL
jgi:molybdopterin molybdotransferase